MQFVDYFIGIDEIFNPVSIYEGDYVISLDNLINTDIKEGQINKVVEYFQVNYYSKLKNAFLKLNMIDKIPLYLLSEKVKDGRILRISTASFVQSC